MLTAAFYCPTAFSIAPLIAYTVPSLPITVGVYASPMPSVSVVRDRLIAGIARGYSDMDWSALGRQKW